MTQIDPQAAERAAVERLQTRREDAIRRLHRKNQDTVKIQRQNDQARERIKARLLEQSGGQELDQDTLEDIDGADPEFVRETDETDRYNERPYVKHEYPQYPDFAGKGIELDAKMDALYNLVGKMHADLKRSNILNKRNTATKWVDETNQRLDRSHSKAPRYELLEEADYDGDKIPDVVIKHGEGLYSYNGYRPKENDYPLRWAYNQIHPKHKYKKRKLTAVTYGFDNRTPTSFNISPYKKMLGDANLDPYKSVQRAIKRSNDPPEKAARSVYQAFVKVTRDVFNIFKRECDPEQLKRFPIPKEQFTSVAADAYNAFILEPVLKAIFGDDVTVASYKALTKDQIAAMNPETREALKPKNISAAVTKFYNDSVNSEDGQAYLSNIAEYIKNVFVELQAAIASETDA
jgi:hypothetical protein